jgi:xanthine dehydrogenase YagS FAD-binding subunit
VFPFSFERVHTEQEAIRSAAAGGRYIAGGTTLIDLMREEVERPAHLVDINALPWGRVWTDGDDLVIGALARMAEVAAHPDTRRLQPLIAEALIEGASPYGLDRRQPFAAGTVSLFPDARCGVQ